MVRGLRSLVIFLPADKANRKRNKPPRRHPGIGRKRELESVSTIGFSVGVAAKRCRSVIVICHTAWHGFRETFRTRSISCSTHDRSLRSGIVRGHASRNQTIAGISPRHFKGVMGNLSIACPFSRFLDDMFRYLLGIQALNSYRHRQSAFQLPLSFLVLPHGLLSHHFSVHRRRELFKSGFSCIKQLEQL